MDTKSEFVRLLDITLKFMERQETRIKELENKLRIK